MKFNVIHRINNHIRITTNAEYVNEIIAEAKVIGPGRVGIKVAAECAAWPTRLMELQRSGRYIGGCQQAGF